MDQLSIPPTINQLFEEYLSYMKFERHSSIRTVDAYRSELKYIIDAFQQIHHANLDYHEKQLFLVIENQTLILEPRHIRKVLNEYFGENKKNSEATLGRKINCLRSFFKFLENNEMITKNPMKSITAPTVKTKKEKIIDRVDFKENILDYYEKKYAPIIEKKRIELMKIKEIPENHERITALQSKLTNLIKKRDEFTLLLRFLYISMARCCEIIQIQVKDLYFDDKRIKLKGKGNKERIVPMDDTTMILMKSSIENRKLTPESYFFTPFNQANGKFNHATAIQKRIRIMKKNLKWLGKLSPHKFRKAGATHLLKDGAELTAIQDILGHSSPNTTRIYVQTDEIYLDEVRKKHPLL